MNKPIAAIMAVALGSLLLVGCTEKNKEPFRDAPQGPRNNEPANIVEMPDGFSNFAHKCIAPGIRGASAYKGDANRTAVSLIADPNCK